MKREDQPKVKAVSAHLIIFLVGWIYYLGIPVYLGRMGFFETIDTLTLMGGYASKSDAWWPRLILYILTLPVMFVLGDRLANSFPRLKAARIPLKAPTQLFLPLYFAMLVAFSIPARSRLFGDYTETDSGIVGPLATLQMVLMLQYLMARGSKIPQSKWLGWLLAVTSFVLVGMGGRLYVATSLLAVYVYWWYWISSGPISRRRSLYLLGVMPILLASIGLIRLRAFDPQLLLYYTFVETFFTSITMFTFVSNSPFHYFSFPSDFLSSFYNIVPSFLWPGKTAMLVSLEDSPLVQAPFGALSMVVSTVGNFGYVGGALFVGLVGFIMGRASLNLESPGGRALYCYLSSLLLFEFFRDPYRIQVKLVIMGFLLVWINQILAQPRIERN